MAMGMTKSIYMHVAGTDDSTRPPLERLRTFMVETAIFFEKFRWAWIAGSTIFWNDPQVRRRKQRLEWRDRYEGLLREIIREGIRRGDIQEVDVALAGAARVEHVELAATLVQRERSRSPRRRSRTSSTG
jgi:hypothetical protein